jgi:hypothetical protein
MAANSTAGFERWKIMDICCHIEGHCSELYQYFAELFNEDREIARIWCLTAVDEDNYVNLFKMASRLKSEGINELFFTIEEATEMLLNIKTLLYNVRNKPPSKLSALRFTIRMEKNLSKIHLAYMANFADERIKQLFSSTINYNQKRIKQLEKHLNDIITEAKVVQNNRR